MKIGYACINMTLGSMKPKITTNRSMVKKTFDNKGLPYVSELVEHNLMDLIRVIEWNESNGIKFYRMSSDMLPWMSEYKLTDLDNFNTIKTLLMKVGELSKKYDQRLTFHPGPFNVLASPNDDVVRRTVLELNKHSEIMDLMGLSTTPYNKINIHVGGVYGDKKSALQRWVDNFGMLDENTKSRLSIENDDKTSAYTVEDLMFVYEKTNTPIVFDYHHHTCHSDNKTHKEALELSISTWPKDITPIVHVSEPRDEKNFRAHHDYVLSYIDTYGYDVDIMVEAKMKELAVLKYIEKFIS